MTNHYTATWFELFLADFPRERTAGEVAFLQRQLALPDYRCVLDMYHRAFFEQHQGERRFEIKGCKLHEKRYVRGDRLYVSLEYDGGREADSFDWQLYLPAEIEEQAARHALKCLLACAAFDARQPATSEQPRVQMIFEKQA